MLLDLYDEPIKKVTNSVEDWKNFLSTAGQNYKYNFNDQLQIYSQKPTATACAELSVWNKLGRRVKVGSKGIRLYEQVGDTVYKKYVFDISDTYSVAGKKLQLWTFENANQERVANELNKKLSLGNDSKLLDVIVNLSAHFSENFKVGIQDSIRSQQEINLDKLINSVQKSSAFMTMKRCGFENTDSYFQDNNFDEILKLKSLEALQNVGDFVSTISWLCINEVRTTARVIKQEEREKNERLLGDKGDISERKVPAREKREATKNGSKVREIFKDEAQLPKGKQSKNNGGNATKRDILEPPRKHSTGSDEPNRADGEQSQ